MAARKKPGKATRRPKSANLTSRSGTGGGRARRAQGRTDSSEPRRCCGTDMVHERLLREAPGYADGRAAVENHCWRMTRAGMTGRSGCTEIPVVVHVVHRTAAENISEQQIESQIDVLNADFRKKNADISKVPAAFSTLADDSRIVFKLASEDPDGNPTSGITRRSTSVSGFSHDDSVKFHSSGGTDAWPRDRYLNIWVCQLSGGLLGYAQFPGGPADTDGVVILHSAFGTTGTAAAPFDKGRTTTHEIGHWLNLRHIWGDDGTGCSGSDFVADTPNQGGPNYGTPTFPSESCGNGPHGDMFMNYMDYVDDEAMVMFTTGQVSRMQAALDGPRSGLGSGVACEQGPKLKVVDDPASLKFRDDPATLKFSDDPATLKFSDDPATLKFLDDPGTLKFIDDPGTLKFFDDSGSLKFFDDGSDPRLDPIKSPGLDKPPHSDFGGDPGWPSFPFRQGGYGGGGGAMPFVLSTPHHSSAWAGSYPGAAQARVAQLEQQLSLLHEQLSQAQQAQAAGPLSPTDQATVERMQQEFQRLQAEYQQLTQGER